MKDNTEGYFKRVFLYNFILMNELSNVSCIWTYERMNDMTIVLWEKKKDAEQDKKDTN